MSVQEGFLAEDDMGARDDTDYQQHEEGDEFANAKDLSDFARLHQQAAAENVTAGPSTSGQNGTAHDADSSDGQPGTQLQVLLAVDFAVMLHKWGDRGAPTMLPALTGSFSYSEPAGRCMVHLDLIKQAVAASQALAVMLHAAGPCGCA